MIIDKQALFFSKELSGLKINMSLIDNLTLDLPIHYSNCITIKNKEATRGRVLFSYLSEPILWNEEDKRFYGHSNKWESREIVRIFNTLGYTVDIIDWTDNNFIPTTDYDVIFDIYTNLQRLAPFIGKNTKKLLHLTGSFPRFQNRAELKRVKALEKRRNVIYSPKRLVRDLELFDRSLKLAGVCSLIGNRVTLSTYPKIYHKKIYPVTVSASYSKQIKTINEYVPRRREFVWFFGGGAVHKGLDLVLEVFSKHPDLTVHILGNLESEPDFINAYKKELTELSNIHYHGFLEPGSNKFKDVMDSAFCFIAPSCSESISTAVCTCMQIGLYPIISRNVGVDLPKNTGVTLRQCSIKMIEQAILNIHSMSKSRLKEQIKKSQDYALENFSREKFSSTMYRYLAKVLG